MVVNQLERFNMYKEQFYVELRKMLDILDKQRVKAEKECSDELNNDGGK